MARAFSFVPLVLVPLVFVLLGCAPASSPAAAARPFAPSRACSEAEYRRLDFWLGEWDVATPDGTPDGTNELVQIAGRCAIEERWTDRDGSLGRSVFYFDRAADTWAQVWVTSTGAWKEKREVRGGPKGAVVFEGRVPRPGGGASLDRTTLTPLPDGRVRQVIAQSADDGATWRTWEGVYTRKKPAVACAAGEFRQFDFWVGRWDVLVKAKAAGGEWTEAKGKNEVRTTLGGCVIEESFHAAGPGPAWNGHSVSTFARGKWRQTWVDDSGSYLPFIGEWKDAEMALYGEPQSKDGKTTQMRMVFSHITKDAIHWSWERTTDAGATWSPVMTIDYARRL